MKLHYVTSGVEGLAGYVDFCYPLKRMDLIQLFITSYQMSKIELLSLAREFNLDVNSYILWWLDRNSGLREIKDDLDALTTANSIVSSREIYLCVSIANVGHAQAVGIYGAGVHRGIQHRIYMKKMMM